MRGIIAGFVERIRGGDAAQEPDEAIDWAEPRSPADGTRSPVSAERDVNTSDSGSAERTEPAASIPAPASAPAEVAEDADAEFDRMVALARSNRDRFDFEAAAA